VDWAAQAVGRRIVYRSEHLAVVHDERGSESVFLTFNDLSRFHAGDAWYWGDALFAKTNRSAIGVVSTGPNWFPAKEVERASEAVRRAVSARRLITYGNSQGGYAALKYGATLGADVSLAFSPQFTIRPDFGTEWGRYYDPALHDGMDVTAGDIAPAAIIASDPLCKPDRKSAEALDLIGATLISRPFTGHHTIRLATGSSAQFVAALAAGCVHSLKRLLRTRRRTSGHYLIDRGDAQLRRNPPLALGDYRRALSVAPCAPEAHLALAKALGPSDEGVSAVEQAADRASAESSDTLWWEIVEWSDRIGGPERAATAVRKMLVHKPDYHDAELRLLRYERRMLDVRLDALVRRNDLSGDLSVMWGVLDGFGRHQRAAEIADIALDREPDSAMWRGLRDHSAHCLK
jgi:hypothetical protein